MLKSKSIFEILNTIKTAKIYNELGLNTIYDYVREPLNVMIIGDYSTGKSTFINALIGKEIAFCKATEATAVVTKFSYADNENVLVHYDNRTEKVTVEKFSKLTLHSEKNSSNNIKFVEYQLPVEILKYINLIDSPGLNGHESVYDNNTDVFTRSADMVFWMFSVLHAAKKNEIDTLKSLHFRFKPLAIVNMMDLLDEEEDDPEEIIHILKSKLGSNVVDVLGISAKDALKGVLNNNKNLLETSNIELVKTFIKSQIIDQIDRYKGEKLIKLCKSFLTKNLYNYLINQVSKDKGYYYGTDFQFLKQILAPLVKEFSVFNNDRQISLLNSMILAHDLQSYENLVELAPGYNSVLQTNFELQKLDYLAQMQDEFKFEYYKVARSSECSNFEKKRGYEYLVKLANNGYVEACYCASCCYFEGNNFIKQNFDNAYYYIVKMFSGKSFGNITAFDPLGIPVSVKLSDKDRTINIVQKICEYISASLDKQISNEDDLFSIFRLSEQLEKLQNIFIQYGFIKHYKNIGLYNEKLLIAVDAFRENSKQFYYLALFLYIYSSNYLAFEKWIKKAIDKNDSDAIMFYARFLKSRKRYDEAFELIFFAYGRDRNNSGFRQELGELSKLMVMNDIYCVNNQIKHIRNMDERKRKAEYWNYYCFNRAVDFDDAKQALFNLALYENKVNSIKYCLYWLHLRIKHF